MAKIMGARGRRAWVGLALVLTAGCSDPVTEEAPQRQPEQAQSTAPCPQRDPLRQPHFGDLHVHTVHSLDANVQGTIITPHQAYRYAMGERLGVQPYLEDGTATRFTQLARPLDFAAVTDHAGNLGETEICTNPEYFGYNAPECVLYRAQPDYAFVMLNLMMLGFPQAPYLPGVSELFGGTPLIQDQPLVGENRRVPRLPMCGVVGTNGLLGGDACLEAAKDPWENIKAAAEAFNNPDGECGFTTFVAYEYSATPLSNNLHRNVIFRNAVVPELPPAYQEYPHVELLWDALDARCSADEGCDYLTIPHNSNLSAGLMFKTEDRNGTPYDTAFAQRRQDQEPLAEIYQHKGQSECLGTQGAGAQDELCGFEIIPYNNLTGDRAAGLNTGPPQEQDYLRQALKQGLVLERDLGANPFQYGFIGSSDTHLGTPGATNEADFVGHAGAGMNPNNGVEGLSDLIEYSPGGLAVLWAEENSRESLFQAMQRREAYATSGHRPIVRFFGGWDLPANMCQGSGFVEEGYANGVSMGGLLGTPPDTATAPRFAVSALRDPGAPGEPTEPLQRIQIIKGWLDDGVKREQVFEVAGDPDNGASVDLRTCATQGSGFSSLCSVWQDPEFDPSEKAFYYARVVDNPSCRWSTRQCLAAGIRCENPDEVPPEWEDCCNADYPKTVQERAWTSPIWYAGQP